MCFLRVNVTCRINGNGHEHLCLSLFPSFDNASKSALTCLRVWQRTEASYVRASISTPLLLCHRRNLSFLLSRPNRKKGAPMWERCPIFAKGLCNDEQITPGRAGSQRRVLRLGCRR